MNGWIGSNWLRIGVSGGSISCRVSWLFVNTYFAIYDFSEYSFEAHISPSLLPRCVVEMYCRKIWNKNILMTTFYDESFREGGREERWSIVVWRISHIIQYIEASWLIFICIINLMMGINPINVINLLMGVYHTKERTLVKAGNINWRIIYEVRIKTLVLLINRYWFFSTSSLKYNVGLQK